MLFSGPATHIGANLRDQAHGGIGTDGINLGEVGAGKAMEQRADIEAWHIGLPSKAGSRSAQFVLGRLGVVGEFLEERLHLPVTVLELDLKRVVQGQVLAEHEDMLATIVDRLGTLQSRLGWHDNAHGDAWPRL